MLRLTSLSLSLSRATRATHERQAQITARPRRLLVASLRSSSRPRRRIWRTIERSHDVHARTASCRHRNDATAAASGPCCGSPDTARQERKNRDFTRDRCCASASDSRLLCRSGPSRPPEPAPATLSLTLSPPTTASLALTRRGPPAQDPSPVSRARSAASSGRAPSGIIGAEGSGICRKA